MGEMKVIYLCPATPYGECGWEGCAGDIPGHFEKSHRDLLVQTNTVRLGISKGYERNILMCFSGDVYLIQIRFDCYRLEMRLRFLGDAARASMMKYYVEVLAGGVVFSSKDVLEDYHPVRNNSGAIEIDVDVLKCTTKLLSEIVCSINFEGKVLTRKESVMSNSFPLKQVCPKKSFFNESKDMDEIYYPKMFNSNSNESLVGDNSECDNVDTRKISTPSFRSVNVKNNSNCSFKSANNGNNSNRSNDGNNTNHSFTSVDSGNNSNHSYKDRFLCSTCNTLVIFPIFLCENKHGVCFACRDTPCRKCESPITNTRDFHLENLSKSRTYKCKYTSKGCTSVYKGYDIYQHEVQCFYRIHTCPVCSNWNGKYNEIDSHFRIVHPSIKLVDTLQMEFPANSRFLIKDSYGLFYCTSLMERGVIEWSVQFYGPKEICFICEIVLQGKTENKIYTLDRIGNEYKYTVAVVELKSLKLKRPFLKICDFNTYRHIEFNSF